MGPGARYITVTLPLRDRYTAVSGRAACLGASRSSPRCVTPCVQAATPCDGGRKQPRRYITVALPLHYRYITLTGSSHPVKLPLHYRCITVTHGAVLAWCARYTTVTLPSHCRYITVTLPLHTAQYLRGVPNAARHARVRACRHIYRCITVTVAAALPLPCRYIYRRRCA